MASIDRTAYPRFRGQLTDAELEVDFTLSEDEEAFVRGHARGEIGRLSIAVSLKTRQRLGYFLALEDVPDQIRLRIAKALVHQTQTETRDQLVEMLIRRMRRTRNRAVERLHTMQKNQRAIEEELLAVFGQVLRHADATDADEELGRNVRQVLIEQGGVESLGTQYHAVTAYHNDNYLPLLWPIHSGNRSTLFSLLDLLMLESSSADTRLLDALDVVRQHQRSRRKVLNVSLDLGFASQRWHAFVQQRQNGEVLLDRHALELCVFMYLAEALQSGDLYVVSSGAYDDYRAAALGRV